MLIHVVHLYREFSGWYHKTRTEMHSVQKYHTSILNLWTSGPWLDLPVVQRYMYRDIYSGANPRSAQSILEYGALTESSSKGIRGCLPIRAAILLMVFEATMVQTVSREKHSLKMVLYSKLMCTVYVRYISNFCEDFIMANINWWFPLLNVDVNQIIVD